MRAVVHDRYGDPADVLRLDPSAPVPEPAAGEVLVRVLVRPVLNPLMMLELLPAVADAWAGKPRPLLPTAAGSSVGRLVTAVSVQRDYALMNRVRSGAGAAALAERFPTVPTIARRLDLL